MFYSILGHSESMYDKQVANKKNQILQSFPLHAACNWNSSPDTELTRGALKTKLALHLVWKCMFTPYNSIHHKKENLSRNVSWGICIMLG